MQNDNHEVIKSLQKRMDGVIKVLDSELKGLRAGQAHSNLLEPIQVEAYNSKMPINQIASVTVQDTTTLIVQVWDKGMIKAVKKAIMEANLGLTLIESENQALRLKLPILSQETRKELVKVAQKYQEKNKIAIRNIRRDGIESARQAESAGQYSKDEARVHSKNIQDLTDKYCLKIDQMTKIRQDEILNI